jgi:hypothetical protein
MLEAPRTQQEAERLRAGAYQGEAVTLALGATGTVVVPVRVDHIVRGPLDETPNPTAPSAPVRLLAVPMTVELVKATGCPSLGRLHRAE